MKLPKTVALYVVCVLMALSYGEGSFAKPEESDFYIFMGADFGFANLTESTVGLSDKSGVHVDVKAFGSLYKNSFILDLGGGWFYNHISNDNRKITTRSAFLEAVAKYRLSDQWSLGPIWSIFLGNDNSFAPVIKVNNTQSFVGLQVAYEPDYLKGKKVRFVGQVQNDISITDRSLLLATVGVQIGFPLSGSKEKVVYKTEYVTKVVKTGKDSLRATIDATNGLYFEFDKDIAKPKMKSYLKRLAYFLKKYNTEWTKVVIAGHTDSRGKDEYNLDLSRRRAKTVRRLLVAGGVSASKLSTRGYGEERPVASNDNDRGRALNRRVELDFLGVKKLEDFQAKLAVIQ